MKMRLHGRRGEDDRAESAAWSTMSLNHPQAVVQEVTVCYPRYQHHDVTVAVYILDSSLSLGLY